MGLLGSQSLIGSEDSVVRVAGPLAAIAEPSFPGSEFDYLYQKQAGHRVPCWHCPGLHPGLSVVSDSLVCTRRVALSPGWDNAQPERVETLQGS